MNKVQDGISKTTWLVKNLIARDNKTTSDHETVKLVSGIFARLLNEPEFISDYDFR